MESLTDEIFIFLTSEPNENDLPFVKNFIKSKGDVISLLLKEITVDERDLYATCAFFLNFFIILGKSFSEYPLSEIEDVLHSILIIYIVVDGLIDGKYSKKRELLTFIQKIMDGEGVEGYSPPPPLFVKIKENILFVKNHVSASTFHYFNLSFEDTKNNIKKMKERSLSREDLLRISEEKNLNFTKGILRSIGVFSLNEEEEWNLSKISQLVDDVIDYEKDIEEGTKSIVGWCVENDGNADFVFKEIFISTKKIRDISLNFLLLIILILISKENPIFSERIREIGRRYSGYDYNLYIDFYYLRFKKIFLNVI